MRNRRGEDHRSWIEGLREKSPPLAPFHWEIEFPEVFDRENPGFDAFIGNPPFLGGKRISTVQGTGYRDWLSEIHEGASRNTDLAAHFFRRTFHLLRRDGTFGLIATNTIAQGDTRSGGLRWICEHGGEIYDATRRYKWPGPAAVVVSVVHIAKGTASVPRLLDGRPSDRVTAFLFRSGGHADPVALRANTGRAFNGMFLRGMGFTFDDTDKKRVASPLAEMRRLLAQNPRNGDVILPFIGGEEVNSSPAHAHHRYAINFRDYPLLRTPMDASWTDATETQRRDWLRTGIVPLDYPEPVAADWPEVLAIVEQRVKPERMRLSDSPNDRSFKSAWWRFGRPRLKLAAATAGLDRVLAISQVTTHIAFAFLPTPMVYSHRLYVLVDDRDAFFACLQSHTHEVWCRAFGSTLGDGPMYSAEDCFETFPFPDHWESLPDLEAAGKGYYDYRAALMVQNDEGLTKTYNRFHDPYETDPGILRLRELHATMDRAVLNAYGWTDIPTDCDFFPLHPEDETPEEDDHTRKKTPKFRYRWPDEIQNDVLARLLDLNTHRATEERMASERQERH